MRKRNYAFSAMLVSLALVLGACSSGQISTGAGLCREIGDHAAAEPSTPESSGTSDLVIGLVTEVGTLDDASFNQYSWEGALQGAAIIGAPEPLNVVTANEADYEANIDSFIDADEPADIIITVGFDLASATLAAAEANPEVHFVGVDQPQGNDPTGNYESLVFNEAQAGYLAGILAGSISESGEVAALGGSGTIPQVVDSLRGFENGVHSVNVDANVHVKYVGNDFEEAFNDPAAGKTFAAEFLTVNSDVDVLFQVAGETGHGMLQSVVEYGIYGFGAEVDQWIAYAPAQICIVTSATKSISLAVRESITTFAAGDTRDGNVLYGADNDGIGLAPYYQFSDLVSEETQTAIEEAFEDMASGVVDPCEPSGLCYVGEEDLGTR